VRIRSRIARNRRAGSDAGPGPGGAAVGQAFTVDHEAPVAPPFGIRHVLAVRAKHPLLAAFVRWIRTSTGSAPCRTASDSRPSRPNDSTAKDRPLRSTAGGAVPPRIGVHHLAGRLVSSGTHLRPCGLRHAWHPSQPLEASILMKQTISSVDGRWVSSTCQVRCTSRPMASSLRQGQVAEIPQVRTESTAGGAGGGAQEPPTPGTNSTRSVPASRATFDIRDDIDPGRRVRCRCPQSWGGAPVTMWSAWLMASTTRRRRCPSCKA